MKIEIDKNLLRDPVNNRMLTQSIFLELGYGPTCVFSLKDDHYEHHGKLYPSLKRLYLEMEDPTEYEFSNRYLLGWKHWQRIAANKVLRPYVEEWREELDMKLRAQAFRDMVNLSASEGGNFSATKWLADRGWDKRAAGRPSKSEKEKDQRLLDRLHDEFENDSVRLRSVT